MGQGLVLEPQGIRAIWAVDTTFLTFPRMCYICSTVFHTTILKTFYKK